MKKGFTLIEIIITVTLLIVIGTTVAVRIVTTNKNSQAKEAESINKIFLEAASLFLQTEVDSDGAIFKNVLTTTNARGVKIPLQYLVDNGYVEESKLTTLKEKNNLEEGNYYILALNGTNESENYCDEGETSLVLSWTMTESEPVYICEKEIEEITKIVEVEKEVQVEKIVEVEKSTTKSILDYANPAILNIDKYAVSNTYYNSLSNKTNFTNVNNTIFNYYDENTLKTYYYYRGSVNNYITLGSKGGTALKWRIMWLDNNKRMKLILDEEIPVKITNTKGTSITVSKNAKLINYENSDGNYILYAPSIVEDSSTDSSNGKTTTKYSVLVDENKQISSSVFSSTLTDSMVTSIYKTTLNNWYSQTNLESTGLVITSNNFCRNTYSKWNNSSTTKTYYPNNVFDCRNNESPTSSTNASTLYSSPVGFITYGEAIRAGLIDSSTSTNIVSSGSYLLKNSTNAYPLVDTYKYFSPGSENYSYTDRYSFYYIDNSGIQDAYFYSSDRDESTTYNKDQYRFVDASGKVLESYKTNYGNTGLILTKVTFYANTVKPAIVINMNGKTLTGNGTSSDPFIIS